MITARRGDHQRELTPLVVITDNDPCSKTGASARYIGSRPDFKPDWTDIGAAASSKQAFPRSLLAVTCGSGPVKRVAAAVGEGSMAISFVHQYIQHTLARMTDRAVAV